MIDMSYKQYKLDNGLTVALKHLDCGTVTSVLRVWQGALDEKPGEEGLVHFLEHNIVFGGANGISPKEALRRIGIFGEFGAYTLLDRTVFNTGILPRDLNIAMEYFAKTAFDPAFDQKNFETEKKVILREFHDRIDAKPKPFEQFEEIYYGDNIKLIDRWKNSVKGRNIENSTIDTLKAIHARGYLPNNSDLIIVGELPDDIEEKVYQNFSQYKSAPCNRNTIPNMDINDIKIKHINNPKLLNKECPDNSSASITISIPVAPYHQDDYFSAYALSQIIGDGLGSRLVNRLRIREGTVYEMRSNHFAYSYTNRIDIKGKVPAKQLDEAVSMIFEELEKLKIEPISNEEMKKMFAKREYRLVKAYHNPENIINHIASNLEYNVNNQDDITRWMQVTPESIMAAATKYLPNTQEGKYLLFVENPLLQDN